MSRPLDRNVVALGVASLLHDVASEMIFPLLPAFLTQVLGAGPAFLGFLEGLADGVSHLLRLVSGWLSDRSGRRKPWVVGGYAVANLVRPLIAVATAPWHVLAVRVADRVGKGMRSAPRDALLAESVGAEDRGRAFGFHRSMDHAGAVVGPLLSSGLLALACGYRTLFALTVIPGLAAVLCAALAVREPATLVPPAATKPPPLPVGFVFDRRFATLLTAVFVFALGCSSDAFLLLALQRAGVATAALPLLWSALHVVKVASVYPLGRLSDRVGRRRLLLLGWLYYGIVYLGFAVAESPATVVPLFLAYGLFYGLSEGAERALVADLAPRGSRGAAFGLYDTANGVGVLLASLIMGALWETYGRAAAFSFGAAMTVPASLLLVLATRRR